MPASKKRLCAGAARPWRRLLAGAVLLLCACGFARADTPCRLKQMEIPVRIVDRRPIATLTLNGVEAPMLLDSGAFFSMLPESTATQLKLPLRSLPPGVRIEGYTGRIDAMRTRVEKVGLLGAVLPNVEFIVGGNELGGGIMGVLGRNILAAADTEYDLAHGKVRLSFPQGDCGKTMLAHWAGDAPVVVLPLDNDERQSESAIRVEVRINGRSTMALLDTGAPSTSLTLRAARRAGIAEADMRPWGRMGGAGEGQVRSWTAPVAQFELGGEKISDNRLQVDDTDHLDDGMLLGLDYFLSHRIYVSRLQRKLYVTWNGGPVFGDAPPQPLGDGASYAARPQAIAPDDADGLARRGEAALAAGQHTRALEDLNRANELAPGVAGYAYARARLHLAMRQARPALADLDRALQLNPALADARMRRAQLRAGLDDHAGAQQDLAQLDATLPPSSGLRADVGLLHLDFDQTDEALRQFELWIATHPNDARLPSVLNTRCWMRTRRNVDLPLALQDCKRAVDLDEGSAALRDSLGWTYLRLGDPARALKAFDEAIKIEPLAFSLYGRGLAFRSLNDAASSERDLAAARQKTPGIDDEVRQQGLVFDEGARSKPAS